MASKRLLKNEINDILNELLDECLVYHAFHGDVSEDAIFDVMQTIAETRNELVHRINESDKVAEGKPRKAYFRAIITDVETKMVGALDALK